MSKAKRIGIVGSRRRDSADDYKKVMAAFTELYEPGDWIISGGCPKGGDAFAERIARIKEIPIMIWYAPWKRLGKAAGFARNSDIAAHCDVLIACVAKDRKGGTGDTVKKVRKLGKKVILV